MNPPFIGWWQNSPLPFPMPWPSLPQEIMADPVSPTQNDERFVRSAFLYLCALFILVPLVLFSLYGQLFGPTGAAIFGIVGFLSAMAVFFLVRQPLGQRFLRACPHGPAELCKATH